MLHEDKIAIVTGAARGIGLACAERLAKEGARLVLADIDDERGTRLAEDLKANGNEALYVHCNVAERLDVHNLLAATLEAFGRVDLLVNNAAVIDDAPFLDLDVKDFDRVLGINLRGAFLVGQAVARQMVKQIPETSRQPAGAIVNMSSINAEFALADHVAYSISKGGLAQLTKAMALALASKRIRVNAVGPGSISTPLLDDVIKDEVFRRRVLSRTPIGRLGRPEEVAAITVWLLSEEASYVTGTTIYADGGRMPLNYVVNVSEPSED